MEMIILLYKHKLQSEEEDLNKIRMEHKNFINMLCLTSKGNNTEGWLENWKNNYISYIRGNYRFDKDDIFNYLVPDKRNCEWVIKNTKTSNRQNIRAKSLIKRVKRFVNTAGHLNEINGHIKEDRNRATLDKFL